MNKIYSDRVKLLINLLLFSDGYYTLKEAKKINDEMLKLINLLYKGEKDEDI